MSYRKTVLIEWQLVGTQRSYFVRPGTRSRPWIWFRNGAVPPFEEAAARFLIEKRAGRWVAVERLDAPAGTSVDEPAAGPCPEAPTLRAKF